MCGGSSPPTMEILVSIVPDSLYSDLSVAEKRLKDLNKTVDKYREVYKPLIVTAPTKEESGMDYTPR